MTTSTTGEGLQTSQDSESEDPYHVASLIALRQLSMAPRTRHQLSEKLAKKLTPPDIIESVLDRMTELGYLDDLAYARTFIRVKTSTKFLSHRALSYELIKAGVDKAIIEQALNERDSEDEFNTACALVAKKLRSMPDLDDEKKRQKLIAALSRKGYSSDVVFNSINDQLLSSSQ